MKKIILLILSICAMMTYAGSIFPQVKELILKQNASPLEAKELKLISYKNDNAELPKLLILALNHLTRVSSVELKDSASTPLVLSLDDDFMSGKKEGYEIIIDNSKIEIKANSEAGLRWGILALAQLGNAGKWEILTLRDSPDIAVRSFPMDIKAASTKGYLDFVSSVGRSNAAFFDFTYMNNDTGIPEIANWDEYKKVVDLCHDYGIKVSALPGYYRHYLHKVRKREFCAIKDMDEILGLYEKAIYAGVDGLSWHFDDLFATPTEVLHHQKCPKCSVKFKTLGEVHAYCLTKLYELGQKHKIEMYWACPSLYSDHGTGAYIGSYDRIDPTLNEPDYFKDFFNFPAVDNFDFYYCYYDKDIDQTLASRGFKNFIWWNNGPWGGQHPEVYSAYVVFPKMIYSWDFYDWIAMEKRFEEVCNYQRYDNLKHAKDYTYGVYAGSYDPYGVALSGIFSWNNSNFIKDEMAVRRYLWRELFGKSGAVAAESWENIAKNLWVKFLKQEIFTPEETKLAGELGGLYEEMCSNLQYPQDTYNAILPHFPEVVKTLNSYPKLIQKLPDTIKVLQPKVGGMLFSLTSEQQLIANTTVEQESPKEYMLINGLPGILTKGHYWRFNNQEFNLSNHDFTIFAQVTPTRFGNGYFPLILGVRETFRDYLKGHSGWGLGLDGKTRQFRFTLEDDSGVLDTLVTPIDTLDLNKSVTIAAVRDYAQKELRLYLDGKLVNRITEQGNGTWSDRKSLHMGFDALGDESYFRGGIHQLALWPRVLSDAEIKELNNEVILKLF